MNAKRFIAQNVTAALVGGVLLATAATFAKAETAAPSPCKGLEQAACTGNTSCTWREALEAGKTMTKAGTLAKVNRKAHCAKGRTKQEAATK